MLVRKAVKSEENKIRTSSYPNKNSMIILEFYLSDLHIYTHTHIHTHIYVYLEIRSSNFGVPCKSISKAFWSGFSLSL